MLKRDGGFTLIELLITMVILVIIATVAIPGFGRLIESNRLMTGTNLLASSIKLARAEAIKRGTNVTFSTDGGLETGWCVHAGDAAGTVRTTRSVASRLLLTLPLQRQLATWSSTDVVF